MKEYIVRVSETRTEWFNKKGQLHREDGPAVEYVTGDKSWWINGKRHREDGHAIEYAIGDKLWYINGQLHREDGPAIEWADGDKSWWINGKELTEKEFNQRMNPAIEMTMEEVCKALGRNIKIIKS